MAPRESSQNASGLAQAGTPASVENPGETDSARDGPLREQSGGGRSSGERYAREVRHVVMRDLYQQVGPLLATGLLTVAIIVAIFWKTIPHTVLIPWTVLTVLSTVARLFLAMRFKKAKPGPGEMEIWTFAFIAGAGLNGLMWGAAGWLFFVPDSILLQAVIVFLLAGMATAGIASYAAHRTTLYAFLIPALLPYGIRLIAEGGETYLFLAALMLFWLGVIVSMGARLNRSFAERVSLQIQNAHLVEHLSRARDEAERANRAKTQFLANVSHEFRTPLNAIIGFSEVMKNQAFGPIGDAKYERYASYIHESGNHLMEIIGETLDVTKIESGEVSMEEAEIDVRRLAENVLTIVKDRAEAAGIALDLHAPEDLPKLRADETKLRQIVINLLSNAVKFTDRGGKVTLALDLDQGGAFHLRVADTGIGMDPADIPRALTPFVQVHVARDESHPGTGLGLPLVKSLVELHGGRLEIASAEGRGTTVTAVLPKERVVGAGKRRRSGLGRKPHPVQAAE